MSLCLVRTFHHDCIPTVCHPYGIEAYQLLDGIGNTLVLDAGCDVEILQIVINEVDCVTVLQAVEFFQRLRHRNIIVLSGDVLGRCSTHHGEEHDRC